jgi:transposase
MSKAGRPTLATEEVCSRVIALIQAGNYIETAASSVGISKSTLFLWLKRGARERRRMERTGTKANKRELRFVEFSDAIERAQAESETTDVLLIGKAAMSVWQAAAWRLERKHPDRWGRHERHEVTGKDGGPIETQAKIVYYHPEDDPDPE